MRRRMATRFTMRTVAALMPRKEGRKDKRKMGKKEKKERRSK